MERYSEPIGSVRRMLDIDSGMASDLAPPLFRRCGVGSDVMAEPHVSMTGVSIAGPARIGLWSYMNPGGQIFARVTIGRYCSIARRVSLGSSQHPTQWLTTHPIAFNAAYRHAEASWPGRSTVIGHDVWIGDGAVVMSGITIGDGCVIGAGAVVTRDVPPYTIVGGVAAKPIRSRFPQEVVSALVELAWWRLRPRFLGGMPWHDVDACIHRLQELRTKGTEELADCYMAVKQ